jgi:hypothetical protein
VIVDVIVIVIDFCVVLLRFIELLLFVLAIYCDAFLFYFAGASCIFAIITTSEYYF